MTIIHRYLTNEILKYIGLLLVVVVGIYVAVDFFEKIDDFMEAGLSLASVFAYFILMIPFIVVQILPVCILLAVLIVFGLMSKNNEIIALKSSGISIYNLLRPLLGLGVLFSILLFFLAEALVPITMSKANQIKTEDIRKKSMVASRTSNIWIKGDRLIIHIKHYSPKEKAIYGVTQNYFDSKFRLVRRMDANKGIFLQDKWVLYQVMDQQLEKESGRYRITFHPEKLERLDLIPADLNRVVKKSEEMGFQELLAYVRKVEAEGYDATVYRVDLYAKAALPLVCVIMCILGCGISFKGRRNQGVMTGIAYGVGIAFLYWVFYSFCISLGYGEILQPVIAAWAANAVFLCIGVVSLVHSE